MTPQPLAASYRRQCNLKVVENQLSWSSTKVKIIDLKTKLVGAKVESIIDLFLFIIYLKV